MGGQAKIEILQEKQIFSWLQKETMIFSWYRNVEVITAQVNHTLNRGNLMEDFRLKLWLSRFTPQEIDDILAAIHLLKLAKANDSLISGTGLKESEYYLRKVNYTIDYITQKRVGSAFTVEEI